MINKPFSARVASVASPNRTPSQPSSARYDNRTIMPERFGGAGNRPKVDEPKSAGKPASSGRDGVPARRGK